VKQELDVSPALAEMMDGAVCCVSEATTLQLVCFASDEFCSFTGYPRREIIGQNCRFLQGRNTTEAQREGVRKLVKNEAAGSVSITNYTKHGVEFECTLYLCPLYCKNTGHLKCFLGSQNDLAGRVVAYNNSMRKKLNEASGK
jgi:PAS domain S-box-containing protein